jgi:membrane-associated phospholipid phosphatase
MMLVSELGGKYELGFIVLLAHFLLKREDALLCATVLCFSILINQQLKLTFAEPRPFFVRPGPPGTPCDDLEYGNPSGHAIAFTSLMLVFKDGVCSTLADLNLGRLHIIITIMTWLFILIVIFSRFYFDAHSIDQLATGFMLGLFLYYQATWIKTDVKNLRIQRMKTLPLKSFTEPLFLVFTVFFGICVYNYFSTPE